MIPANFEGANRMFVAPPDLAESQCRSIPAFIGTVAGGSLDGSTVVVVASKPTPEEVVQISHGQPIYLSFIGGLPPHFPCMDFAGATHPA